MRKRTKSMIGMVIAISLILSLFSEIKSEAYGTAGADGEQQSVPSAVSEYDAEADCKLITKSQLVILDYKNPHENPCYINFPREGKVEWESRPSYARWAFNTVDEQSDDYYIGIEKFPQKVMAGSYFVELVSDECHDETVDFFNALLTYTYYPLCKVYYIDNGEPGELESFYVQEKSQELSLPTGPLSDEIIKGYRIEGWYEDRALTKQAAIDMSVGKDYYVYPRKTPIDYSITYDLDGGINSADNPASYTIEDGRAGIIELSEPTRAGYRFLGWYSDQLMKVKADAIDTTQCKDVTVYAKWEKIHYQIIYEDGGDTNKNPSTYTVTDPSISLNSPSRKGYSFSGWYLDEEHTRSIDTIDTGLLEDITVYGAWTIDHYSVSYELNGGEIDPDANITSYTVEDDDFVLKPPTKEHYDFDGWYKGKNFLNKINRIMSSSCEDLMLYAKWTEHKYNIIYEDGGDTNSNPYTYTMSDKDIVLTDAVRRGYTFAGWYFDKEHTRPAEKIDTSRLEDLTIYGAWKLNQYSVSYELNEGSIDPAANITSYTVEDEDFVLQLPQRELYNFAGWYLDEALTERVEKINASWCQDLVLYAKWEEHPFMINYEHGGVHSNPVSYTYTDETIVLEDGFRKGYTFDGWYLDEDHTRKIEEIDPDWCEDITIYGAWTLTTYHVKYEMDDGTNSEDNITEYVLEDPDFELKEPTKYGCTFDGWYMSGTFSDSTKVNTIRTDTCQDITLYAKWQEEDVVYSIISERHECNGGRTYWEFSFPTSGKITLASTLPIYKYNYGGSSPSASYGLDITYVSDMLHDITQFNGAVSAGKHKLGISTMINDFTVSYTFVPECKVYYVYENATTELSSYYLSKYMKKEPITKPSIKGYKVVDFYRDRDLTAKITTIDESVGKNWYLYPKVEPITYSVSYDLDGGINSDKNITSYTIEDRDFTLKAPVKTGYTFDGWYTSPQLTLGTRINKITTSNCKNLVLYAKWSKKNYSIEYVDSYTHDNPRQYTITDKDIILTEPEERNGYTFDGWYKDAEYSEKIEQIECSIASDLTIYAKWTQVPSETPAPTMTAPPRETEQPVSTASSEPEETDVPVPTASSEPEETEMPVPTASSEPKETEQPSPTASSEPEETDVPVPTASSEPKETEQPVPTAGSEPEKTDVPVPTASSEPEETEQPVSTVSSKLGETEQPVSTVSSEPEDEENDDHPKEAFGVGAVVTAANGYKYKFVSNNTVQYCGASMSATSVSVPDVIVIRNKRYPVVAIAARAFANHRSLKKVTIGKNIKTIGKKAFYNCKDLKRITIRTSKLAKKSIGSKAFSSIHPKAVFRVPQKKVRNYTKILKSKGVGKNVTIK